MSSPSNLFCVAGDGALEEELEVDVHLSRFTLESPGRVEG
jgi:hypothetical protein